MKGYTSISEIENYLLTTIDEDFKSQVNGWIEIMENYVDSKTGRNFKADTEASDRYFNGNGKSNLLIDECVEVEEVSRGTDFDTITALTADDYFTFPYVLKASDGKDIPIRKLISRCYSWYKGIKNIKVKAKWGYSVAVPDEIAFATMIFVCGIINYSLNADGEVSSKTIGRYTVTFKEEKQWQDFDRANEILKMYKKHTF